MGDLNHDGKLDLAAVSGTARVSVLLGAGKGTFSAPVSYTSVSGSNALVTADVDGDGNLDLIVAGGVVAVLFGKGNGTFWNPATYSGISYGVAVQVADLDGDGNLDLAVTSSITNSLSVFRGRGYGTFDAPSQYFANSSPSGLAIADFNGDGSLDIAATNLGNTVTVLLSQRVIALFPSSLTFGPQTVGTTSKAKTATISNPGTSGLSLGSVTVTGTNAGDFLATNSCGKSLAIGKSCSVTVTFRPSAKGARAAALKITDNALGRTQLIT